MPIPWPLRLLLTAGWNLTASRYDSRAPVVAGAGASTVWFLWVLRRFGLRLRFAAA